MRRRLEQERSFFLFLAGREYLRHGGPRKNGIVFQPLNPVPRQPRDKNRLLVISGPNKNYTVLEDNIILYITFWQTQMTNNSAHACQIKFNVLEDWVFDAISLKLCANVIICQTTLKTLILINPTDKEK